jgi:hypothetical protein
MRGRKRSGSSNLSVDEIIAITLLRGDGFRRQFLGVYMEYSCAIH